MTERYFYYYRVNTFIPVLSVASSRVSFWYGNLVRYIFRKSLEFRYEARDGRSDVSSTRVTSPRFLCHSTYLAALLERRQKREKNEKPPGNIVRGTYICMCACMWLVLIHLFCFATLRLRRGKSYHSRTVAYGNGTIRGAFFSEKIFYTLPISREKR